MNWNDSPPLMWYSLLISKQHHKSSKFFIFNIIRIEINLLPDTEYCRKPLVFVTNTKGFFIIK